MCQRKWRNICIYTIAMLLMLAWSNLAYGAPPAVKTVRVLSSNPVIPHDVCSGVATRLKGTSDVSGTNIQFTWDFGDGSPAATGTVANPYVIEASHTYTVATDTVYIARLTVTNSLTSESASKDYPLLVTASCTLNRRVDMAIDEGLWYLHKTMTRGTANSVPIGYWNSGYAGSGYYGVSAANVNAFEVNGFLKTNAADDPYTETVSRGLDYVFTALTTGPISTQTNPVAGTFSPDFNGNGIGIFVNQGYPFYQGGPFIDAIVASGTATAIAALGVPGVVNRQYKDIVQDMLDYLAYCQYDASPGGGWRYNCQQWGDNSACQWVAIGVIPAQRQWGLIFPQHLKTWNVTWLAYTQALTGTFGYGGQEYTGTALPWGPYATTPSGMVQLAMDGIGRGNTMWDRAETFMRDNFGNAGGAASAPKSYYYGLFSLTKSLLLHDSNGDGVAEPLKLLRSSSTGVPYLKWYDAEQGVDQGLSEAETGVSAGMALGAASTHGIARTLVDAQNSAGYWSGHNYDGNQFPFETAWAIIMLRRTVVQIPPVAKAEAFPNPVLATLPVTFDGSTSYHPDPNRQIVTWEWDLDNNGTFETNGVTATRSFPVDGNYLVTLRVTDNGTPALTGTMAITIVVKQPPIAPTANAGGPYNFCANRTPWFLDGRGSLNPDQGTSEPGMPGNTIIEYAWELDGNNTFNDAFGATPDVTSIFTSRGVGSYLIQLRVTDNSGASHPSFGGNLSDTDSGQVNVLAGTEPACSCVNNLAARAKPTKADLTWTWRATAHHYNVYRGAVSGGPYLKISAVAAPGLPNTGVFADSGLSNGITYYYVVREAANNNDELCQSNQAMAKPTAR